MFGLNGLGDWRVFELMVLEAMACYSRDDCCCYSAHFSCASVGCLGAIGPKVVKIVWFKLK